VSVLQVSAESQSSLVASVTFSVVNDPWRTDMDAVTRRLKWI
jgi:hypothetical protein